NSSLPDRCTLRLGSWAELAEGARLVRTEVFLQEQQIPVELEWDDEDATALHAVAYDPLGQPVATGRLLRHGPGKARIGRMAVRRPARGQGWGGAILQALLQAALVRGDHSAWLHAQCSVEAFYRRHGFEAVGPVFEEAGIPHQLMRSSLSQISS